MTLILRDIIHRFGGTAAVAGASLEAAAGEIVCLFGHSGCGKTTLLRIAAGLEPLQAGEVTLDGAVLARPGAETPPERRPIGFVFQDYVLFPHLTVEKNVAYGLAGIRDAGARVNALLEAFGIAALARRYPHQLSGGQQQRVALARAMARRPKALLLDEPFASIDVALRRKLRDELRRVLKEQNAAVLLVTHDADEALALGDRIALMRAGKITEIASPEFLYRRPQTREGAMLFPGSQTIAGEVKNGAFHSALGAAPANGVAEGAASAVLRADALSIAPEGAGGFHVADCRYAGPGWTITAEGPGGARLAVGADAPMAPGAPVGVAADWSKSFLFPGV